MIEASHSFLNLLFWAVWIVEGTKVTLRISDTRIIRLTFFAKFLTIICWRSVSYFDNIACKTRSAKMICTAFFWARASSSLAIRGSLFFRNESSCPLTNHGLFAKPVLINLSFQPPFFTSLYKNFMKSTRFFE